MAATITSAKTVARSGSPRASSSVAMLKQNAATASLRFSTERSAFQRTPAAAKPIAVNIIYVTASYGSDSVNCYTIMTKTDSGDLSTVASRSGYIGLYFSGSL